MKVYGSALFTDRMQHNLSQGALLDVPQNRISTLRRSPPDLGDLLWVKEEFAVITSRKAWLQGAHFVFPGPKTSVNHIPPQYRSTDYVKRIMSALRLERADSRATLEILTIMPTGVHCRVHMVQADEMLKRKEHA